MFDTTPSSTGLWTSSAQRNQDDLSTGHTSVSCLKAEGGGGRVARNGALFSFSKGQHKDRI